MAASEARQDTTDHSLPADFRFWSAWGRFNGGRVPMAALMQSLTGHEPAGRGAEHRMLVLARCGAGLCFGDRALTRISRSPGGACVVPRARHRVALRRRRFLLLQALSAPVGNDALDDRAMPPQARSP